MPFVNVVFNLNIDKAFTYHLPSEFRSSVFAGQRVLVPFGKREITGIIVKLNVTAAGREYKDVIDLLDNESLLDDDLLALTRWMADYYLAAWGQTLQLALPKGLDIKSQQLAMPAAHLDHPLAELSEKQTELFDLILREPGRSLTHYRKKSGTGSFYHTLRALENKGHILLDKQLVGARVGKKTERMITVTRDLEGKLSGLRNQDRYHQILLPLAGQTLRFSEFTALTGLSAARIKTFSQRQIVEAGEREIFRTYENHIPEEKKNILLNDEQKHAVEHICTALDQNKFKAFLLHGVTGSGKTQVYLESIQRAIDNKKSAIVLVPEISLTPQTVGRFESFFPGKVHVFHSRMGLGERYDTWRRIAGEEISIVIGPRSALFLPVKNPGIIIIDEEHDASYKQDEKTPRYHARDTAIYRAKLNNAVVVLGSATPSLESYYNARVGKYHLLRLTSRIDNLAMPAVDIVDLKKINPTPAENRILSPYLENEIRRVLEKKEQIILLQNRRGFSSFLQCQSCGFTARCQNCDISLTYHTSTNSLQCHYCGYSFPAETSCPKCQGTQIKFSGAGTQRIENILRKKFPSLRLLRMDIDSTSGRGAHEKILRQFKAGDADILLGTQMIAKGLDFENVSLVGVISADIGLTLPDFRSAERIFQLLTQVAGRPGRKNRQGKVIIQTAVEGHYTIHFARSHNYDGFYQVETGFRHESQYPPFGRLIKLGISAAEKKDAPRIAGEIARKLSNLNQDHFRIIGPAPSPLARLNNKYRWQIILKINRKKDPSAKHTRQLLRRTLSSYLSSPANSTQVYVDVDPVHLM